MSDMDFGQILKSAIERNNKNARELSLELHFDDSYINKFINGRKMPLNTLIQIANYWMTIYSNISVLKNCSTSS